VEIGKPEAVNKVNREIYKIILMETFFLSF